MPDVAVHGVVGIGVDEALVAGKERLREVLTSTCGEVEKVVRIYGVAESTSDRGKRH